MSSTDVLITLTTRTWPSAFDPQKKTFPQRHVSVSFPMDAVDPYIVAPVDDLVAALEDAATRTINLWMRAEYERAMAFAPTLPEKDQASYIKDIQDYWQPVMDRLGP